MAVNEPKPGLPQRLDLHDIDPHKVLIRYDRKSDTLVVHLFGRERAAKVLHTGNEVDLRIDPTTREVVGFQVEGYLRHAIYRAPGLLWLAEFAGIEAQQVDALRGQVAREWRKRLNRELRALAALERGTYLGQRRRMPREQRILDALETAMREPTRAGPDTPRG